MRPHSVVGLTLTGLLMFASAAQADWPSLNPFATAPKEKSPYNVKDGKSSSWMPSLPSLPTWGKPAPRNAPTTWQKVKATPGKVMNKTQETLAPLNPFKTQPKKTSMYMSPKKQDEVSGFWPNWMTVAEKNEADQPKTVTDWLNAPKPGDDQ
jgi:hypothetical protein